MQRLPSRETEFYMESTDDLVPASQPRRRLCRLIPLLLGAYLLLCGAMGIFLLVDVWGERLWVYGHIFYGVEFTEERTEALKLPTYTVIGSLLGATILSFRGLHIHGAERRDFQASFSGSYIIGPWAAALLGLAGYALIRGGLLVFGGTANTGQTSPASHYAYLGFGFLTGFAWNKVLSKLDAISANFFAVEQPAATRYTHSIGDRRQAEEREPLNSIHSAVDDLQVITPSNDLATSRPAKSPESAVVPDGEADR
jgi:hypothetical protein